MSFFRHFIRMRFWFVLVFKAALICTSFLLSCLLRYDFSMPASGWSLFVQLVYPLLLIKLLVFWRMGLNHGWWKYVSLSDVIDLFKANIYAGTLFLSYVVIAHGAGHVPLSLILLDSIICFLLSCGVRFATRAYRENYFPRISSCAGSEKRVLIVGAGYAGQMIVREMRTNRSLSMSIAGYIDDDPTKQRQRFQGLPVLGTQAELSRICRKYTIDEIIIAIPSATGKQVRAIVERCLETRVKFKTLPSVGALIDDKLTVQQIKDVDMEDLLGREPVRTDVKIIGRYLTGKRIMITGAAGSIGSEICRQVSRFQPALLILLDNAETPLFFLERELRERFPELPVLISLGDVRARIQMTSIFDDTRPEVVFHAAAYKHVPMMEVNQEAAVHNNIRGTKIVADAAHYYGVKHFVMISTDKAVNPTNVMGASKRAAELYVQNLSKCSRTNFVTVRFGNVLGSNGSVIPIFQEQIRKGGPLTVTHPEVIRYFMTIPEATQLVLQAGAMGKGGEIFLLDMGEPVKILSLAEQMIRLSGLRPYEDIDIVFTGLRPGEKLYEELLLDGEGIQPTDHEKIMVARAEFRDFKILSQQIEDLYKATMLLDMRKLLAILEDIVPEYNPRDEYGRNGARPASGTVQSRVVSRQ